MYYEKVPIDNRNADEINKEKKSKIEEQSKKK